MEERIDVVDEKLSRILSSVSSLENRIRLLDLEKRYNKICTSVDGLNKRCEYFSGETMDEVNFDPRRFNEDAFLKYCFSRGMQSAVLKRVPSDYYSHSLEWRRDALGASSVDHLFKTIVLENTRYTEGGGSKYYAVIIQYSTKLCGEKLARFIRKDVLGGRVSKKHFNFRLTETDICARLTGYEKNAVTPVGMLTDIPTIISKKVTELKPSCFWMGGGEVDLKLRVDTKEFIAAYQPLVADITHESI